MENEIKCYIYSMKNGNKIKTFNISQQMEARDEYRMMIERGDDVAYFEGNAFPLDLKIIKFNPEKRTFETLTKKELVDIGEITLKRYEKIILNNIMIKEPYEMYEEGLILTKPYEIVFKIDRGNVIKRKNLLELIAINFSEKEIKDGLLEKIVFLFDAKFNQLKKKYPEFEIYNFNYKTTQAYLWAGLDEPAKLRILRSESRMNSFGILFAEFYHKLTEEEKTDTNIILAKLNNLTNLIIEKEKIYKDNYSYLMEMRNNFTSRLRDMALTEKSVRGFIGELNGFYGENILEAENTYLSEKYYATIPIPDTNFYN